MSYCLVTSEAELKQACKTMDFESEGFLSLGADAQVEYDGNKCIVHIKHCPDLEDIVIYALLTHEAVHIFQAFKDIIREQHPSSEFEAYTIQEITLDLCHEYKKRFLTT